MRRTLRRRGKNAFTLLEVMMGAMVLVMAIISSIATIQFGLRAIDSARYTTLAGQILQSQMEKIRLLTWSQLTNSTTGPVAYTTFTPDVSSTTTAQLARFTCTQTIVAPASPFDVSMRVITLTASWNGIDGRAHSLSYLTRYCQNGISDFFYTSH